MVLMSDESGPGGGGKVINDARRSHLGGRLITSWPLPVWGRNEKGGDGGGEHPLVCIAPSSMAPSSMSSMAPTIMTSMAPTSMPSMASTHQFGTSSPSGEVVSQRANGGPTHQSRDATYLPYLVPAHLPPD